MPRRTNKYGLSNYVPATVARKVRQECGFGCVMCGCMICDYDHFNPQFKDLQGEHRAEGIALLCKLPWTKGQREHTFSAHE